MKQLLLLTLMLFSISTSLAADETDTQVLVFSKTGDVTLIYAEELQSVNLSTVDTDSIDHPDFISQDFIRKDGSVFKIMLADIDSVAFGNRNKIVPKTGVHEITEADIPYITDSTDGVISFKAGTPVNRIPSAGQYVYYIGFHELFPWGLCAKVDAVTRNNDSSVNVNISDVPASEVFDEFFFSGEVGSVPATVKRASRAGSADGYPWDNALKFAEQSEFSLLLNCELTFTNVVANVLSGYYHANIAITNEMGMTFNFNLEEPKEAGKEYGAHKFYLPPLALGTIQPIIEIGAFWEAEASAKIDYSMTRTTSYHTEWTRRNGVNTFSQPSQADNPAEADPTADEAKFAIVLDGSLFGGFYTKLSLNTFIEHLGAGVRLRGGAELAGNISVGAIADMASDHTKPAVNGNLDLSLKLDIAPYWYTKSIFETEKDEHIIGEPFSLKFQLAQLSLFPSFTDGKAVPAKKQPEPFKEAQKVCTAAAISEIPIPYPLETGFELVNTVTNEVVDSIFTTDIEAFSFEQQGISADLDFGTEGKIDPTQWQVRPVFRYGNHTLASAPIALNEGARLSPFIFNSVKSGVTVRSSFPAVGSYKADERVFEWCGTPNVRRINKAFIPQLPPTASLPNRNLLKGSWKSTNLSKEITITFLDDEKGAVSYDGLTADFTYTISSTGEIRMQISEENITRMVVIDIDASVMIGRFKNQKSNTTFKKQ